MLLSKTLLGAVGLEGQWTLVPAISVERVDRIDLGRTNHSRDSLASPEGLLLISDCPISGPYQQ
jgi:hypothetical protein